jgi:hypothetical protein
VPPGGGIEDSTPVVFERADEPEAEHGR